MFTRRTKTGSPSFCATNSEKLDKSLGTRVCDEWVSCVNILFFSTSSEELKELAFFKDTNWDNVLQRKASVSHKAWFGFLKHTKTLLCVSSYNTVSCCVVSLFFSSSPPPYFTLFSPFLLPSFPPPPLSPPPSFLPQMTPPLIPPRGEVNAADAFDIGNFDDDETKGVKVSQSSVLSVSQSVCLSGLSVCFLNDITVSNECLTKVSSAPSPTCSSLRKTRDSIRDSIS